VTRLPAALALSALFCCAHGPAPSGAHERVEANVRMRGVEFQVRADVASDEPELGRIGSSLLAAQSRLARWGTFRSGVLVRVLQDHAALEAAVDRPGYWWLRAWAFGDHVLLQSPRTWTQRIETPQAELDELLAHELTHALMYQLLGDALQSTSRSDEPPLWFREGMASVTAGQGSKRLAPAELARWVSLHPGKDLLNPDAELLRNEKDAVYGAAHRAFERLLALGGDQSVRDILRDVRSGARFEDAFAASVGRRLNRFEAESVHAGFEPALTGSGGNTSGAGGP
jgi:hypothetical protein